VSYTLLEPGEYYVHVATGSDGGDGGDGGAGLRFEPVYGSPFALSCGAGPVELSCCQLLEVGMGGEPLGRVQSVGGGRLWIQTRDQLANNRSTPSSHEMWCEIRVPSPDGAGAPQRLPCACVDLGDGRIEATYPSATPSGLVEVWIGLVESQETRERAGRRVSGGGAGGFLPQPEHKLGMLRVDPAIQFADSSLVTSPGVLRVKPGVLFDILVLSADDAGRQQQSGGEQLRAQLTSGPAPVALEVYDNGDGSYRVATAVQVSGEYKVAFYVNGLPVAGSPILLVAPRTVPGRGDSPRGAMSASSLSAGRAHSPRFSRSDSPRADSPRGRAVGRADSPRGDRPHGRFDRTDSPRARVAPSGRGTGLMASKPGMPPRGPVASALPAAARAMASMYDSTNLR
jgi:hypothetical protein